MPTKTYSGGKHIVWPSSEVSNDRGTFKVLVLPPSTCVWGVGRNPQPCQKYLLKITPSSMHQIVFDNSESFKGYGVGGGGDNYKAPCTYSL